VGGVFDVGGKEVHLKITVILCTYNRCQTLANALESVALTKFSDPVEWEVLVVDNNSKDQTRVVVEDYCRRYPGRFRYLFEGQQGKSYALNAGIRASDGDVIAFMDDDVTVDPMWLQNLTAPLQNGDWAGAGGRTLPAQPYSLPRWLTIEGPYEMGGIVAAVFDLGDRPGELDRPPYGTNMAFQRKMFDRYGLFRTDLGPRPGSEIRNEDTDFGRRLMSAGERLRYEPSAIVYHPVLEGRLKKDYLLKWRFDMGRAAIWEVGKRPDVLGLPRFYFSIPNGILGLVPKILSWMLAFNPQRRFYLKTSVWYFAGQIVEIYRRSRSKETGSDAAVAS
jgi:glycosyltransferase involved in cell wall biosynthesis